MNKEDLGSIENRGQLSIVGNEAHSELKAKTYRANNLLTSGIAGGYAGDKNIYISQEALDKICSKFKGYPVVIEHKDLTAKNVDKEAIGHISNVYPSSNNSYGVEFLVHKRDIENLAGKSISSSYSVSKFGNGGVLNGVKYDQEVLDGDPLHLAIVDNPRYNDTEIFANSFNNKTKNKMRFAFNLKKKQEDKETSNIENSIELENDIIEVENEDGSSIEFSISEAVKNAKMMKKNKKKMSMDNEIEFEGEIYTVGELFNAMKESKKYMDKKDDKDMKKNKKKMNNSFDENSDFTSNAINNSKELQKETGQSAPHKAMYISPISRGGSY